MEEERWFFGFRVGLGFVWYVFLLILVFRILVMWLGFIMYFLIDGRIWKCNIWVMIFVFMVVKLVFFLYSVVLFYIGGEVLFEVGRMYRLVIIVIRFVVVWWICFEVLLRVER